MSAHDPPAKPDDAPGKTLPAEEIISQLTEHYGPTLFLGLHTPQDTLSRLESRSIPDRLKAMGFSPLHLEIDPQTVEGQELRLYDQHSDPERLLMRLRLRLSDIAPSIRLATEAPLLPLKMLKIEWAVLQNPRAHFTAERPRLPEQRYPGLGIAESVGRFLEDLAKEHHCDGLMSFPQHYHNAVIYGRRYVFFHPSHQGKHEAMVRDLRDRTLAERSFAIDDGFLRERSKGTSKIWEASEMVRPLSRRLTEFVRSRFWRREVTATRKASRWKIDWDAYDRKKEK